MQSVERDEGLVAEMNGHPRGGSASTRRAPAMVTRDSVDTIELPVRSGKKAGTIKHRPLKGDGATVLTANQYLSVKLLRSTPAELRAPGVDWRGSLLGIPHAHLALAITRRKAYVWDYTAHVPSSGSTRTFDVPWPARGEGELPFGALVPGATGSDVGLVLVGAEDGKVVFYESIERASAGLELFGEKKTGVEGVIASFASSEHVVDLIAADHAGFILRLSTGRIVHMTLRDAQGKAKVFTQPLRPGEANAGLLGSLRGLITGPWKRDVVSIKTRSLDARARGEMQVVSLTRGCEVQLWDVSWSGNYAFQGTVDFRGLLAMELRGDLAPETQGAVESLSAEDFVIVDKTLPGGRNNEVATLATDRPLTLWVLLATGTLGTRIYHLAQLTLVRDEVNVDRIIKLGSYPSLEHSRRPRVAIPRPGHTALVAFDHAVIVVSTTTVELPDDPNAQLHGDESYIEPQSQGFEDVIFLKEGGEHSLAVTDLVSEETKGGHTSAIAFVSSAGLMRISVVDPTGDVERSRIPVKSKIEQAIFYGALGQESILDFSQKGDAQYSANEVEEAALAISDEVLRSVSHFINTNPTSIDSYLDHKTKALRALVSHVRRNYPVLSRAAMWKLLWDAEKVAAAREMWRLHEDHVAGRRQSGQQTAPVLQDICRSMREKGMPGMSNTSEENYVRRFMIYGLQNTGMALSCIYGFLSELPEGEQGPDSTLRVVAEADELWQHALQTIFSFRADNASLYGIPPEIIEEGILNSSAEFTDLPEPWTSSADMLHASSRIPRVSRDLATAHYDPDSASATPDLMAQIGQIRSTNPDLIKVCCLIYRERIAWLESRHTKKEQGWAEQLTLAYERDRHEQFRSLAAIGSAGEGMALAERYGDMQTLTELVMGEVQYVTVELDSNTLSNEERKTALDVLKALNERITRYFKLFGDRWADAFFNEQFDGPRAGHWLQQAQKEWGSYLTAYLRREKSRGRVGWINDVTAVEDFARAAASLLYVGQELETKVWGKKVESAMGKLCLLAAQEESGRDPAQLEPAMEQAKGELMLVHIQDRLYAHVRAETVDALDEIAAVQLAMDRFATKISDRYMAHEEVLRQLFTRLLAHRVLSVEELLDVLTLSDNFLYDGDSVRPNGNLDGTEFALALEALEAVRSSLPQARLETLLKLTWKRCYTYDDWATLTSQQSSSTGGGKTRGSKNNTTGSTDADIASRLRSTAPFRTLAALYDSGKLLPTSTGSSIQTILPSQCLDVATSPADLSYRFPDPELLQPILADERLRDEELKGYVSDRNLDEWVKALEKDAKAYVEEKADRAAEEREKEREVERELDSARVTGNGAIVQNGSLNGELKHSLRAGDAEGDVEMV